MRIFLGVAFAMVASLSNGAEISVLSGGAAKSFIEPLATPKAAVVDQFIAYLTGPRARERLAQAGYTSPE